MYSCDELWEQNLRVHVTFQLGMPSKKKKQKYETLSHSRLTPTLPSTLGHKKMGHFGLKSDPLPPIKIGT